MKRIACSALTGTIFMGNISKDRLSFTGEKQDVTSDCIKAVCEKFEDKGTQIVQADGKPVFEITVTKITPAEISRRNMIAALDGGDDDYDN